ncbi:MAG: DUF480 domain-containing protein [Planctomycetales bacterium]
MSDSTPSEEYPPLRSLSKPQRRVLGTLVEKALTVPESYPLTLKALTTGCNQKSGREPLSNYGEEDVADAANELRELGLAAVVHTESGRTERYRHYLRRRWSWLSEPQVAILAELLLRGRQSIGDLRARASRMAPAGSLDGLDQLRNELAGLMERQVVQSDAPLDRRGVEIDHNLYEPQESRRMVPRPLDEPDEPVEGTANPVGTPSRGAAAIAPRVPGKLPSASNADDISTRLAALEAARALLQSENQELHESLGQVREELTRLGGDLQRLREALGA